MANNNEIHVIGLIIRDGVKVERKSLAPEEQRRLADKWNSAAMTAAGFTQVQNNT